MNSSTSEEPVENAAPESTPGPENLRRRLIPWRTCNRNCCVGRTPRCAVRPNWKTSANAWPGRRSDAIKFGNVSLLEDLLPVIDNFRFGLEAARQESESSIVFQGMSMVMKQLSDFLASQGVSEFGAPGEVFDPNSTRPCNSTTARLARTEKSSPRSAGATG